MPVELKAGNHSLLIEQQGDADWYRCTVVVDGVPTYAGADAREPILRRLADALHGVAREPAGEIDGIVVRWVFSLSEQHFTLYIANEGETTLLFWQDADARLLQRWTLTPDDVERWLDQLDHR